MSNETVNNIIVFITALVIVWFMGLDYLFPPINKGGPAKTNVSSDGSKAISGFAADEIKK